ncbi:RlpA-like double-psi beta-barrel-protein domain-containing protein-containing protein [Xylaria intraflava]|nr:RlpA-like double-psi beta-barrel-protein domain-containing protein-containing protein [Xylaria intraflava]
MSDGREEKKYKGSIESSFQKFILLSSGSPQSSSAYRQPLPRKLSQISPKPIIVFYRTSITMRSVTSIIIALGLAAGPVLAFSGKMTHYSPSVGTGSCGWRNGDGDLVVALSPTRQAGACGKMINIHANGKTVGAKVVDTCPGCGTDDIDVSPGVFDQFGGNGVISVTWEFA